MAAYTLDYRLNEADVEVHFIFNEGYPATWEEPGCEDDIEVQAVVYQGVNIINCVSDSDMEAMYEFIDNYKGEDD